MEQHVIKKIRGQIVSGFLDCVGGIYVFSKHLAPNGNICTPTGAQLKTGIPFIIDVFDRRNVYTATAYYGKCGLCKSKLVMPKRNLTANG